MSCTIKKKQQGSALNQLISLWNTFCDVNFEAFFKAYRKWHNHEGRPFQCAYARSHATKTHSATQLDTWRDRESSNALNGASIFCNRSTKNEATETGHSHSFSVAFMLFVFSVNVSISSRAPLPFSLSLWPTITTHTLTKTETNLFFKNSVFVCFDFSSECQRYRLAGCLNWNDKWINCTTVCNYLNNRLTIFKNCSSKKQQALSDFNISNSFIFLHCFIRRCNH